MDNDWLAGKFYSPFKVKFVNDIPLCPDCNSEFAELTELANTTPPMGMAWCHKCKSNYKILLQEVKKSEDPDQLKMFEEVSE